MNSSNIQILREMVYRWSKTQDLTVAEQLNHGIRYLDLRIAADTSGTL